MIIPTSTIFAIFLAASTTVAAMVDNKTIPFNENFQQPDCGELHDGRFLFYPIPAANRAGDPINLMTILYDTVLRTAVSSTGLYTSDNTAGGVRYNNWVVRACPGHVELDCRHTNPAFPAGYARGHLLPSCYWRWTDTVARNTFFW
ncbi:uncharacterized protein LOC110859591 [Folsomia candida]|uniref:uncharacterized protein LOC110859591 n=1 Tax=Folsomia candida TaxID=158441 RepID=UPI000B8F222E|nr:uncharacterized protein LOC110859591 [Folsomia candida]